MIKLQGHTLAQETRFSPEGMKVDLTERSSTASFTAKLGDIDLQRNDWLMDNTEPCAGIVWRVKGTEDTYDGETTSVQLEHVINTLKDVSMFGDVTAKMISGEATCTAKQAARYILNKQSIWQLGDFEFDDLDAPFEFNGETLFDALEIVTSALDDPVWEYDMTRLPFRLHIRKGYTTPECEMRCGRNVAKLKKQTDWSKTFTRIYPIGKNNLQLPEKYLSKNEDIYGRIDKIQTDQSQGTVEMLRIWAKDWLKRHCEPKITITVSGLYMSMATGEPMDRLTLNRKCRVPLPQYATTISERIAKLSWKDKIKEPENVQVTLCNELDDIASIINKMNGGGGRGGRADAKDREEDHAWFVDTESHVAMVAEAIIGRDPESGVDWSRVAEIIVDGSGIHQKVLRAAGSITEAYGRIDMNEESVTTIFEKTGIGSLESGQTLYGMQVMSAESLTTVFRKTGIDSLGAGQTLYGMQVMSSESLQTVFQKTGIDSLGAGQTLYGMQQMSAESLTTIFQKTGVNSLGQGETLYSRETRTAESFQSLYEKTGAASIPAGKTVWSEIQQAADKVGLVVGTRQGSNYIKAGEICLAINNDGTSEARINASKVLIGNQTADVVIAGKCTLNDVTADYISAKIATLPTLRGISASFSGNLTATGGVTGSAIYISGSGASQNLAAGVKSILNEGSGNNVDLHVTHFNGNEEHITFKKATTPVLSGSWGSGVLTVSSDPAAASNYRDSVYQGAVSWNGNVASGNIMHSTGQSEYATGATYRVDATARYTAGRNYGWEVAVGKVSAPAAGTGTSFSVKVPDTTYNTDRNMTFSIAKGTPSASGGYASVSISGTVVGRIDISNWWTEGRADGWTGCYNSVGLSQTTDKTLGFGESITIYAQAYQTPNATVKSNHGSVKITAPSEPAKRTVSTLTCTDTHTDTTWTITVKYDDSNTVNKTLDATKIYAAARVGYTKGAFTKYQSVSHSGNNRGSSTSIQAIGNAVKFKRHTSSETPSGTWYSIVSSGQDLTYYLSKAAETYYTGGSSYTYYTHHNNTSGDLYEKS